ncbi:MAG: long-chain fatty acid--CoA ligase [Candidatus Cloacimonetes bacterium]|nr:long-chain fatty acid--CoA ligase [Candidatus Cloacimonadota bacterium]
MNTAAKILLENAQKYKDEIRFQIPVEDGFQAVLWDEYLDKTRSIALYLNHIGVTRDDKVAVYSGTCVEWVYAGFAAQASQGVLVPVYHSNTKDQVHYVLEHSDAKVVFVQKVYLQNVLDSLQKLPLIQKVVCIDGDFDHPLVVSLNDVYEQGAQLHLQKPSLFHDLVHAIQKDDIASMIYTSGTTGQPKGVLLSHENVVDNGEDWLTVLEDQIPQERVDLLWLPLSHIFGWGEIGLGNTLNFTTWFVNPKNVLSLMPDRKPTVFMSVPAYWEKLYIQAQDKARDGSDPLANLLELTGGRLQFCLSGGAGLKREVKDFFLKAGMFIVEGYGLTEASPTLTMNSRHDYDFDSVGKPFPRVEVKLLEDGEIVAKGSNIFKGYYKNQQASLDAVDTDGYLLTGDLGEFTSDGFLKIIGRKKDIIVTAGGKNISPQLIEQHYADDPLIEHLVLYGNEKKYLVAMVTLRKDGVISFARENDISFESYDQLAQSMQIRDQIQNKVDQVNGTLSSYETAKSFFVFPQSLSVEAGHITPSLKIKRNQIHKDFFDEFEGLY